MESPSQIIEKHCQNSHVEPFELLTALLDLLQQAHVSAGFSVGNPNNPAPTVYRHIESVRRTYTPPKPIPKSMLEAISFDMILHWSAHRHSIEIYSKNGHQTDLLERQPRAEKTLLAIIQEMMNSAEYQGIDIQLRMEEQGNKAPEQDGDKDPPADPPPDQPKE